MAVTLAPRVTQVDLDKRLEVFNRMAGSYLVLNYTNGGVRVETSNGAVEFSPRLSKGQMADWLAAMIKGAEIANTREYAAGVPR